MHTLRQHITILLVEDEPAHAELIKRAFESDNKNSLTIATTLQQAEQILNSSAIDLIISDMRLPDGDGTALLQYANKENPCPVIIMTSFGDETLAVKAIKKGAADYIVKSGSAFTNMPAIANRVMHEWQLNLEKRRTSAKHSQLLDMMEATPDLIATANKDNFLTYMNTAGRQLLGIATEEELQQLQLVDFYSPQDAQLLLRVGIPTAIREGSWKTEISLQVREQKEIPISQVIVSHKDEHGDVSFFSTIIRDLSYTLQAEKEKKDLETKLIRAQKMEAIGFMAGGVAHDLNNILSGVIGYPELLLHSLPADSELREPIIAIHDSGTRAATIVSDLLTVVRGAASTREPHCLNTMVQEYLNSPEHKALTALYPDILFQHQLSEQLPHILCSPVHIKKSIMNLMTNAAEAIIGKGSVTVTTATHPIEEISESTQNMTDAEYVLLTVSDSGSGIASGHLERIFEPFYTNKVMGRSGSGLGLAVVWNTAQDHNGQVFVKSSGQGTSFQLCFPIIQAKNNPQVQQNSKKDIIGNGERILIVDDEPLLRDVATKMLKTMNYTVDSVSSGELAIEFIQKTPVDLIVIDMLMDPGISGRETFVEISKLYPQQKAIIASGFSKSKDVNAALQCGVNGFIKKPYSMQQLGSAVKKALTNQPSSQG